MIAETSVIPADRRPGSRDNNRSVPWTPAFAGVTATAILIPLALLASPKPAVVIVPVADVWSRPLAPGESPTDDLRETQVLFGEKVLVHESSGSWVRIEAIEQPEFTHHNRWEGYPGWANLLALSTSTHKNWNPRAAGYPMEAYRDDGKNHFYSVCKWGWLTLWNRDSAEPESPFPVMDMPVPLGGSFWGEYSAKGWKLSDIPEPGWSADEACFLNEHELHSASADERKGLVRTARLMMNTPYLWGGLVPGVPPEPPRIQRHRVTPATTASYGSDCSGLVHVVFRANRLKVPRDAHEQWMKAKPIKRSQLKPADLVFVSAKNNPKKIGHVAMFSGWSSPHPALSLGERDDKKSSLPPGGRVAGGRERGEDGQLIEAPQTGMVVREISFKEKFGKTLSELESGDVINGRTIYFGSFLK